MDFYTFDRLSFSDNSNEEKPEDEFIKNKKQKNYFSLSEKLKFFSYCGETELHKILALKEFIRLVDKFLVFSVTEEYTEFLFELKLNFDFVQNLYLLIKNTNFIYDGYSMRSKSLENS